MTAGANWVTSSLCAFANAMSVGLRTGRRITDISIGVLFSNGSSIAGI